MIQATHASTPRRRGLQSVKCEKAPAEAQTPLNGTLGNDGLSIAALSAHLADLHALHISMDAADITAQQRMKRLGEHEEGTDDGKYHAACRAHGLFEGMAKRTFAKVSTIEAMILDVEPKTADETLTLAAIFWEALDSFSSSHSRSGPDPHRDSEWETLERAIKAIVRGLIASGASSPVLRYYLTAQDLLPWTATRSSAVGEAAAYQTTEGDAGEVQS